MKKPTTDVVGLSPGEPGSSNPAVTWNDSTGLTDEVAPT